MLVQMCCTDVVEGVKSRICIKLSWVSHENAFGVAEKVVNGAKCFSLYGYLSEPMNKTCLL